MKPVHLISSVILILASTFAAEPALAQQSAIGDGYVLIAPLGSETAYLINSKKQVVHTWACGGEPGNATYLLEDGSLLRTGKVSSQVFDARGGAGGNIRKVGWDGTLLWDFDVADQTQLGHHDVEPLPGGNVLVIAWEYRSRAEAIAAGRDPNTMSQDALWPETILEIEPQGKQGGKVVWKWRLWDHLIQQFDESKANYGNVADHPELIDLNYAVRNGGADWIHMNSVDYNAELDQIALSARWFNELWVIDHSTTTQEAAGHAGGKSGKGGDVLYRWGNPEAYFGGFPFDRQMFTQHDIRWIDKGVPGQGNLMLFNNGDRRSGREFSSVDEFTPPLKPDGSYELSKSGSFAPKTFAWSYSDGANFSSGRISGAQRLPGGNTLICSGDQGWVFEVTPDKKRVWEFELSELNLRGGMFRAPYYRADHPAFRDKQLSAK